MRVEHIGDATLYLGDCREILPTLSGVDAVVTDPPYEKEAHRDIRRTQSSIKTGIPAALDFDAITEDLRTEVAAHAARLASGWALFFCQVEAVPAWRDAIEAAGAKYKRAMVWVKPDSSPQFNGQGPAQGYESIVAAWCGAGHSVWNGGGRRGVFEALCNQGRFGGHPTEKPTTLMRDLVSLFTAPENTILDPFAGSGSTGVACIQLGRRFIGIEVNPAYFDIACRRIEEATKQGDLIRDVLPKAEQKALGI